MKKKFLSCIIALVGTLLFAQPAPISVKMGLLNGPSGIGMVDLIDNDLSEYYKIETKIFGAPKTLLAQLLKEEWDFAVLPTNMAALLYNKGVSYQLAALVGQGNLSYITSDAPSLKKGMEAFRGKVVALPGKNTTPDLIFSILMKEGGVNFTPDYRFNPQDLAKALGAGLVSAGVLPEPLSSIVLSKNPKLHTEGDLQKEWETQFNLDTNYPLTVLVVKKSFAENNPKVVKEVLIAVENSLDWVEAKPYEAAKKANSKGFSLPPKVFEKAIAHLGYTYKMGEEAKIVIEPYFKRVYAFNPKVIGGKQPNDSFYLK